jgi:hypothetical protein
MTWTEVSDTIARMRTLEDDWDGLGCVAPEPGVIDYAMRIARFLQRLGMSPPCRAVAGVNGTIQLEWYTEDRGFLEVEVAGQNAEVFAVEGTS